MGAFLEVRNLTKQYPNNPQPSISNISFSLKKNQVLAVMGESGSGKTTLLRTIAGLEQAEQGAISFQNTLVKGPKDQLVAGHQKIKLLNQSLTLPHSRTISESIAYQLKSFDTAYAQYRTNQLLDIFKLEEHKHKTPNQLSGGQKQRALFAWAIADEPPLLLMDEPLSHLDDQFKLYIYQKIFQILHQTSTTIIFATHQAEEVFRLADYVMVLHKGQLLDYDTPKKVYQKPQYIHSAYLMGAANVVREDSFNKANRNKQLHSFQLVENNFLIRPHQLHIHPSEKGFLEATLLKSTFMGEYFKSLVKISQIGQPLLIHSPFDPSELGEKISISW
jgi:iron(III) transport system ATP-binding protein